MPLAGAGPVSDDADGTVAETFRDEWPPLLAAAMRIVGDLQTAEDVVQETIITALDRWPLLGVPDRPGAWLMTACRNVIRDAARAQQNSRSLHPFSVPAGTNSHAGWLSQAVADRSRAGLGGSLVALVPPAPC